MTLSHGYELDDDKSRIDRAEVHRFLSEESYWGKGRPREVQDALIDNAARVLGLYHNGAQVGFCRAFSDGWTAYLADVYVLEEHRGQGLGEQLVREMVERGALSHARWLLHTEDMHRLYRKLGFVDPSRKVLERPPR